MVQTASDGLSEDHPQPYKLGWILGVAVAERLQVVRARGFADGTPSVQRGLLAGHHDLDLSSMQRLYTPIAGLV